MTDGIDNTAPPFDPTSIEGRPVAELEAELERMAGEGQAEPGDEPEEATEDTAPEESEETGVQTIEIDGETFAFDQLKELVSKGKDYTRKTQELGEQRKEVEQLQAITQAWNSGNPEVRQLIVQHMAKEAGIDLGAQSGQATKPWEQSQTPEVDLDELTDNERAIYLAGERKAALLEAQLKQVNPLLEKLNTFVENETKTRLMDQQASAASAELAAELGIAAPSVDSIKAAVRETGNPDHKAAWLLRNAKQLVKAGVSEGARQVVEGKPSAPGKSGTRTFDPMARNPDGSFKYSGDEAGEMMARGWKPVTG